MGANPWDRNEGKYDHPSNWHQPQPEPKPSRVKRVTGLGPALASYIAEDLPARRKPSFDLDVTDYARGMLVDRRR